MLRPQGLVAATGLHPLLSSKAAQCRNGSAHLIVAHDETGAVGASIWRSEVWQTGPVLRCLALYGQNFMEWKDDMRALAVRIAVDHRVRAVDGTLVKVHADTLCIHGDTPGAVERQQVQPHTGGRVTAQHQCFGTGINPCVAQIRNAVLADNVINVTAGGV